MTRGLRTLSAEEFARRLATSSTTADHRFAFFIGAGCSRSSGIPAAGELVETRWLPRLRSLCDPGSAEEELSSWARKRFPEYDPDSPAASYGAVMEQLFLHPGERQSEIEALCEARFPRFGYATLASLISHERGRFNVVLTTNFDDLMADALYLFTQSRPLVIQHAALSEYIRPTRSRPLVVKVHGDHQLAPLNTAEETGELAESIKRAVQSLLHDRGLIFLGYGGADQGILRMLESLSSQALPFGVYWVSRSEPRGTIRSWLECRNAVWVEYADFDKFMVLLRSAFELPKPDEKRFEEVFQRYADDYLRLSSQITALPDATPAAFALKEAVKRTDATFEGPWSVILEARRLQTSDPEKADEVFHLGVRAFPDSSALLGSYANFLHTVLKDFARAEAMYERALAADPEDEAALGNYANLLADRLHDFDRAEAMYERALAADPTNTNNLRNYALFFEDNRKDFDRAEAMFERAVAADPQDGSVLGSYALFLHTIRKDFAHAEAMYERALAADPQDETTLGNYALFLKKDRKDFDRAEAMYERALAADPTNANNLGNYALFLHTIRNDPDHAEAMYERAVAADPTNANNLGNYAGFLLASGRSEEGLQVLDRAIEIPTDPDDLPLRTELWFYAFAHWPPEKHAIALCELRTLLEKGVRSPGWDLAPNVQRSCQDHHPDCERLEQLADVLGGTADIADLNDWTAWKVACSHQAP
jgi:tetratricopeptide (TPR) repeat protein